MSEIARISAGARARARPPSPATKLAQAPAVRQLLVSAVDTPLGRFYLASCEGTFCASAGPDPAVVDALTWAGLRWPEAALRRAAGLHYEAQHQLADYCRGRRRAFDLPLDIAGDEVLPRAWRAARDIPYGKTLTYGELAFDAGVPGAARAIGRAMSLCPLSVLVPCHRVVSASGRRRGSDDGWQRRQRLLEFERAQLTAATPSAHG